MKKRIIPLLLTFCLLLALPVSANAAERNEEETAAAYLFEMGIMVGDQSGNMMLDSHLTRAQLATILTRLNGNPEHVQAEQAYYIGQCKFSDVPEWAKLYVGYCYANGLMLGYDTGTFGADDGVTPQAACTVILRYLDPPDVTWDYSTACQAALSLGLTSNAVINQEEIARGDLAVMIYRALSVSHSETPEMSANSLLVSSYKGTTLTVGDRSALIIGQAETGYTVTTNNSAVLSVEQITDNWVVVANAPGNATVTVTAADGRQGTLSITVTGENAETPTGTVSGDLTDNMEIREEIVALVNQVRQENGKSELPVNQALMDAAQEYATHRNTWHDSKEECELALAHGYPYGFSCNLTVFTGASAEDAAETAVKNWVNSPGHFQTMIDSKADSLGVGVERYEGVTYCYLFVGMSSTHNPYE